MSTFALGGCVTRAVRRGEAARPCIVSGQWEERNRRDGAGRTGGALQVTRHFFKD